MAGGNRNSATLLRRLLQPGPWRRRVHLEDFAQEARSAPRATRRESSSLPSGSSRKFSKESPSAKHDRKLLGGQTGSVGQHGTACRPRSRTPDARPSPRASQSPRRARDHYRTDGRTVTFVAPPRKVQKHKNKSMDSSSLRAFGEITASLEVTFQSRSQHWQRFAACLGGFKSACFNGCREHPLSPTTSDRDSTASILTHAASR